MYFYQVCVADTRATKLLTYRSKEDLPIGSVISVPFGSKVCLGVVISPSKEQSLKLKDVIDVILDKPLPGALVKTLTWLLDYYPSHPGVLASACLPSGLKPGLGSATKQSNQDTVKVKLPKLNEDQKQAISTIISGQPSSYLLHGITGSGKTRVYIEIIRKTLESGRSALLLSPEIGLTSQLSQAITQALPNYTVHVLHSSISPAKRRDTWLKIINSDSPQIIIGPRSTLFSPVHNLGLVIVDEAHDSSYKQHSQPYYLATRVAAALADFHKAKTILGTATPLVSDYFVFKTKGLPIVNLNKKALSGHPKDAETILVDIKDRSQFKQSGWLSEPLIYAIEKSLKSNNQSVLFLNRRGTARITMCSACGWQAICPRCDIPLTFHGDNHELLCHTCGFKQSPPSECPICQAADVQFRSIGTKFLVDEIRRIFPQAIIKRFDSDIKKSDQLQNQYQSVAAGDVDILVGTQVLTKGWDLPKLSVIGLVTADTSLYFPDFSADELTFQHLTQALGRIGRGHVSGTAVVQTYQPQNQTILSAMAGDYLSFYELQIRERQQFNYPPFVFMMKIWSKRASRASIQKAAQQLASKIQDKHDSKIQLLGPSPAFQEQVNGKYVWQLVIKTKERRLLVEIARSLPSGWSFDIDPINLL